MRCELWPLAGLREVVRLEDLPYLGLALPSRPVFLVKFHEAYRSLDRLLFRVQLELRVASDNLLGLGERSVDYSHLPAGQSDADALRRGSESTTSPNRASLDGLFAEDRHGLYQFLGRGDLFLSVLHQHYESHCYLLLLRLGAGVFRHSGSILNPALLAHRTRDYKIDIGAKIIFSPQPACASAPLAPSVQV